jgi:hypothetical protein
MTTTNDERPNVEYGDREVALKGEILRTTVGSGLHGIEIAGTDDNDEMGVYIEPPQLVLGVHVDFDRTRAYRASYIWRTQPEGARSGPGDTDLVLYELRKFLKLAVKGNPTVLLPLFAPEHMVLTRTEIGDSLRRLRGAFLSAYAVERFLSYMWAQHDRMLGYGRRGAVPNRPELVEKYGFDTKYAAHALRLAYQGQQIARDGRLELPMLAMHREHVLQVKTGHIPLEKVSAAVSALSDDIRSRLLGEKPIAVPPRPDLDAINDWSREAHLRFWRA